MYFVIRIDQKSICFVSFSLSNTENYTWSDSYRSDRQLGSISPTFYMQFFVHRSQKGKKAMMTWLSFYAFGMWAQKAAHKTLMKSITDNCVFKFLRYAFAGWKKFPKNKIKHVFTCFLVLLLLLCSNKGYANKLDHWLIK